MRANPSPSAPEDDGSAESGSRHRRARRVPWSRLLLGVAIAGPPLWIGGVFAVTVPVFLVVVTLLCVRLCTRTAEQLRIPWPAVIGLFAVAWTLLQCIPLPDAIRWLLATGLEQMKVDALRGTEVTPWPSISPVPADTVLEAARLLGLTMLFVAAAQLSWRVTAALVATTGTTVAFVAFAHQALGAEAIYGIYRPVLFALHQNTALTGTFVNSNHQAGLLLLGIFSAGALAADQHSLGTRTRDPARVDRYADRFLAAMAAVIVQVPALVLTLSRGGILTFLLLAPVGLVLGLRGQTRGRRRTGRMLDPVRFIVIASLVVVFAVAAQHGAWRELGTVLDLTERGPQSEVKFRLVRESFSLVALSPWLGIGRGAYIDIGRATDSVPTHVWHSHLESVVPALIVDWGPLAAGVFFVASGWFLFTMVTRHGDESSTRARRLAVLGVLAVVIQNMGDHSYEFLGVMAPASALAGALAPNRHVSLTTERGRRVALLLAVPAMMVALLALPRTWMNRADRDIAALGQSEDPSRELRWRPLDARLHGLLARRAAEARQWQKAHQRSVVATDLWPGAIDPWFLRSAAAAALADPDDAERAMTTALSRLHEPPSDELVRHLIARYPEPRDLARLAPDDEDTWRLLFDGVAAASPAHADALAEVRASARRDDPEPLRRRAELALAAGEPALGLHHARLMRQMAPHAAAPHLLVARAYMTFSPPRPADARRSLELALRSGRLRDENEQGRVEEELLAILLHIGDAQSLAAARLIANGILDRPANRDERRRREMLIDRVRESAAH